MKFKALVSFAGKITMAKGQIREISNQELISDLLNAKYIEAIEEEVAPAKKSKSKK